MASFFRDVKFAIRTLSSSWLFSCAVLLSLGLGIGASTAVFSFVNAVLLRPLPYRDPGRLVLLWASKSRDVKRGISGPDLDDVRSRSRTLEGLVPFVGTSGEPLKFGRDSESDVKAFYVGTGFSSLLGVRPYLGRGFRADEEQSGAQSVALISYTFWKSEFAGDPEIVGRTIILGGSAYEVIGVVSPEFFFPDQSIQIWLPIKPEMMPATRTTMSVHAIARLRKGVTLAQARAEMDTIAHGLASDYPGTDKELEIGIFPATDEIVGDFRGAFWSVFCGVLLLLLIACANIAHLFLVRGMQRSGDVWVRVALGATRRAIFSQFLTESLLLGAMGGLVGIVVALVCVRLLILLGLSDIPRFGQANVGAAALSFAAATSVLACSFFGALPAWRISNPSLVGALKHSGATRSHTGTKSFRDLLMVTEVALAFVLMASAGLLINSFVRLSRVRWGFDANHLLVVDTTPPHPNWFDVSETARLEDRTVTALSALPGVISISASRRSPMGGVTAGGEVTLDGKTMIESKQEVIAPNYFRTMGINLLRGREFTDRDSALSPKVAVIDQALANRLWPGRDPIGKTVRLISVKPDAWMRFLDLNRAGKRAEASGSLNDPNTIEFTPFTVVGEATNVLMDGPISDGMPMIYECYPQHAVSIPMFGDSFLIRTTGDPAALESAVRLVVQQANQDVTIQDVDSLSRRLDAATGGRGSNKLLLIVSSVTSALALLLAAVGIYGIVAYTTTARTREIGVRAALGAQQSQVFRMILGRGFLVTIAGLLFGLLGALATTKVLASYLFGVTATDPMTFASSAALFLAVTFLACYFPTRRATRINPVEALRYE